MHPLEQYYAGLDSTDPTTFDTSFDALLFSDDTDANRFLVQKCVTDKHDSFKRRITLQILSARGSQDNEMHWGTRYMGDILLKEIGNILVEALSDVDSKVRREAIMSMGDLCNNTLNHDSMVKMTTEYPNAVIALRYTSFVQEVLSELEDKMNSDIDVDVQLQAKLTYKEVKRAAKTMAKSVWAISL